MDYEKDIIVEGQKVTVYVKNDTFEKVEVTGWLIRGLMTYTETLEKE